MKKIVVLLALLFTASTFSQSAKNVNGIVFAYDSDIFLGYNFNLGEKSDLMMGTSINLWKNDQDNDRNSYYLGNKSMNRTETIEKGDASSYSFGFSIMYSYNIYTLKNGNFYVGLESKFKYVSIESELTANVTEAFYGEEPESYIEDSHFEGNDYELSGSFIFGYKHNLGSDVVIFGETSFGVFRNWEDGTDSVRRITPANTMVVHLDNKNWGWKIATARLGIILGL
ncbi:MAG: hypothetical protein ACEPO8_05095 [Rhodothermaceae bacterium]